jgi:hypothetical protein
MNSRGGGSRRCERRGMKSLIPMQDADSSQIMKWEMLMIAMLDDALLQGSKCCELFDNCLVRAHLPFGRERLRNLWVTDPSTKQTYNLLENAQYERSKIQKRRNCVFKSPYSILL